MTRHIPPIRSILCCLAWLALGPCQADAELQMGAQLSQPSIAIGDSTLVVVQIAGVDAQNQPRIEVEKGDADGISSRFVGKGSQVFRDRNGVRQVHTFRFSISALKQGEYTLAAALDHEGETFGTDPMQLTVRDLTNAEKAAEPKFRIDVENREIYLGELLPIKLIITTSPRTSPEFHNVSPEVESNGFIMQPLRGIFRGGLDTQGNDNHYFEGTCEALRAGELTLGPATYPMQIISRDRSFGRSSRRRYKLSSDPVTIKVKPLPSEGKPSSFSGTVGKFSMNIEAQPLKLKQGEPISVSLVIAGEGNLPSIDAPLLTGNTDAWKQYDPSRVDSRDDTRNRRNPLAPIKNSGQVTFTRMIVPLETETEIPPFEFSFFDPETGAYRTLRTDPIPIDVAVDPNATAAASPRQSSTANSDQKPEPAPTTPPPLEEMTDILSIRDLGDQKWQGARKPLAQSKLFWALQAPPAAALLGLLFIAIGRRRSERETDSGWAGTYPPCAEILRKLESKPDGAREFYQYAHEFLEAWGEQNAAAGSTRLELELAQAVQAIHDRHNFLSFGSPNESETSLSIGKDEQQDVIRTLKSLPGHA